MFIISFLRKKQTIIYIIIVALIWSLWPISDILSTIKKDVINKQNKGIFDAICQVIRDETIASIFKINTVYHDDILREISQIRFKKYHHYINGILDYEFR